jgi:hypothetical protein
MNYRDYLHYFRSQDRDEELLRRLPSGQLLEPESPVPSPAQPVAMSTGEKKKFEKMKLELEWLSAAKELLDGNPEKSHRWVAKQILGTPNAHGYGEESIRKCLDKYLPKNIG